ncbi:MAG: general secretion pathway protein GspK [Desulfobacteraceae bacterium]|nr:general secretion pathway protein GspK [Desulfobacteraceae bacterium]
MILNNKKGMALIVTLAIVSILVVGALEIGRILNNSVGYVKKDADFYIAYQIAISGINLGQIILSQDAAKNEIDSVQESWADSEKIANSIALLGYDKGTLKIKISDELGKIQINALLKQFPGYKFNEDQRKIWQRFLDFVISSDKSSDDRDPSEMINCIKDWLDSKDNDAITGISGAESDYYLELDPSYQCANAPLNKLSELFMIKGFDRGLFKTENMEISESTQQLLDKEINAVFTIQGIGQNKLENKGFAFPGKININTANELVLAMILPVGKETEAAEIVSFRKEKNEETFINKLDKGWYKRVVELSKNETKYFERVIRYSSNVFKVEAIAEINNAKVVVSAIVERKKMKASKKWTTSIVRFSKG